MRNISIYEKSKIEKVVHVCLMFIAYRKIKPSKNITHEFETHCFCLILDSTVIHVFELNQQLSFRSIYIIT